MCTRAPHRKEFSKYELKTKRDSQQKEILNKRNICINLELSFFVVKLKIFLK